MDTDAPFKSPRPPAPRHRSRSRGHSTSMSRAGSRADEGIGDDANLTPTALLGKLEGLLVAKSNEIQLAGRLGEALLTQQAELENRIRELEDDLSAQHEEQQHGHAHRAPGHALDNSDDESVVGGEVKEKLHALEAELRRWERGNEEIYKVVGLGEGLSRQPSSASTHERSSTPPPPLPSSNISYDPDTSGPSASAPTDVPMSPAASRRQRNAQHRANDIEFATEIGQSLLSEVRRLQALLSERDGQLSASRAEKDGMERAMESLANGLKSVEESVDKYREENWNLEVRNQEVSTQLAELSGNLSKAESERARLARELAGAREALDTQKVESERLTTQVEGMKSRHETDMANMRRTAAGLQREKTDLQTSLDGARKEIDLRTRGIRRSVSAASGVDVMSGDTSLSHQAGLREDDPLEDAEDEEDDVFGTNRRTTLGGRRKTNDHLLDSPSSAFGPAEGSPAFARLSESEKLAHAQKTIQTLRAALLREKEAKMDLKRKLGGAKGAVTAEDDDEDLGDEDDEDDGQDSYEEVDENQPEKRRRTITAGPRGRGRGRGAGLRGGLPARRGSLVQRLPRGLQPSRLSSEVPRDSDNGSIIDHGDVSLRSDDQEEELASFRRSQDFENDDRAALRASQGSLAGMDPAFMDSQMLPASSSSATLASNTNRQTSLGSLFKNNRPDSAMFADDFNLAEQLRLQEEQEGAKIAMKEAGTMTEPDETPALKSQISSLEEAAALAAQAAKQTHDALSAQIEQLRNESRNLQDSAKQADEVASISQRDLQSDIERLSSEAEQLRRTHEIALGEAQAAHSSLKDRFDTLTSQHGEALDSHRLASEAAAKKEAELIGRVEQLREEARQAQEASHQAAAVASARQQELESQIEQLSAEAEQLKNAHATALGESQDAHRSLTSRFEALQGQHAQASQAHQEAMDAAKKQQAELGDRIQQLQSELSTTQEASRQASEASSAQERALSSKIAELEAQAEKAQAEASREATAARIEQEKLSAQLANLRDELDSAQKAAREAEDRLQKQIADLEAKHGDLSRSAHEKESSLTSKLEEMVKEGAEAGVAALALQTGLQNKLDDVTKSSRRAADEHATNAAQLNQQISSLGRQLEEQRRSATHHEDQLNKRIEQLVKRAEEASQAAQASEGDLHKQVDRLMKEAEDAGAASAANERALRQQFQDVQRQAAEATDAATSREADLKRQLERMQEEARQATTAAATRDTDHTSMITELEAQAKQANDQSKALEGDLRRQLGHLQSELASLTSSTTATEESLKNKIEELHRQQASSSTSAREQAAELGSQLAGLEKEKSDMAAKAAELESRIATLLSQHDSSSKSASEREAELTGRLSEYEREKSDMSTKEAELQSRLASLLSQHENLTKSAGQREADLQTQLAALQNEKGELSTREADLQTRISSLLAQHAENTKSAETREGDLGAQLASLNKLSDDSKAASDARERGMREELAALTKQHADTAEQYQANQRDLTGQLVVLRQEADDARSSHRSARAALEEQIVHLRGDADTQKSAHAGQEREWQNQIVSLQDQHSKALGDTQSKEAELLAEIARLTERLEHKAQTSEMAIMTEPAALSSAGDRSDVDDTTIYLSGMHSASREDDATTPTMESTPIFGERSLPSEHPARPASAAGSILDDSSVAGSFKSFSRSHHTDYDTATETDGDFEDARETLATFDGLGNLSNASHSTLLRGSARDSDDESDFSVEATPRFPGRRRVREPTITKEVGTSPMAVQTAPPLPAPAKPVLIDAAIQTDDVPVEVPVEMAVQQAGRPVSVATFGYDAPDSAKPAAPTGVVYIEKMPTALSIVPDSRRTSVNTSDGLNGPISPTFEELPTASAVERTARQPKLSVPPPPSGAPPKDALKLSSTPTFRPPRPSSPPPPELLQRAQSPTFLAPSTVSRKRSMASDAGSSAVLSSPTSGRPGLPLGMMPLQRDEHSYGASPAPLPHHRPPTQPRSQISHAQLRNAPPIRYQAASAGPSEAGELGGRAGATTPVNQMRMPPTRYGSTQRRKSRPISSAASLSSAGSTHSRKDSAASSIMSDVGVDGLPTGSRGQQVGNGGALHGSTDPAVIHAITQTMIGEFLFKYTRTTFSKETSEKRHQRFFWIHPYTKTLYWSNSDPGAAGVNQSKSRGVYIAGVRTEKDSNPYPPGLYQTSIIVSSVGREIKLTAPTQERHEMWMAALNYLLARQDEVPAETKSSGSNGPATPSSGRFSSLGRSVPWSASSTRFRKLSSPSKAGLGVLPPSRHPPNAAASKDESTLMPSARGNGKGKAAATADPGTMYKHESVSEPRLTPKPSKRKMSTGTTISAFATLSGNNNTTTHHNHNNHAQSAVGGPHNKKSDTPAAEYQHYLAEFGSPRSVRSYTTASAGASAGGGRPSSRMSMLAGAFEGVMHPHAHPHSDPDASLEIIDRRDALGDGSSGVGGGGEDGYEGLENVRACCNGEHDVGRLSVARRHGHHHIHPQSTQASSTHSASRTNSVASRASSRMSRVVGVGTSKDREAVPPLPTGNHMVIVGSSRGAVDEPGSPSLRARTLSSTLRRKSVCNELGGPSASNNKGAGGQGVAVRSVSPQPGSVPSSTIKRK